MANVIKKLAKKIAFRYTSFGAPNYPYGLEPIQLAEAIKSIDYVNHKNGGEGCFVEVGVARGMTSRFICEHIANQGYRNKFYCLDTFSSFTEGDLKHEIEKRGKNRADLDAFDYNDFEIWKKNFDQFDFVKPIKSDASTFDFSSIAPISFMILDVDLYVPTTNVLANVWGHLCDHAVILVDDVKNNNEWDGAYQAYTEFVIDKGIEAEIIGNKCGVIRIGV